MIRGPQPTRNRADRGRGYATSYRGPRIRLDPAPLAGCAAQPFASGRMVRPCQAESNTMDGGVHSPLGYRRDEGVHNPCRGSGRTRA